MPVFHTKTIESILEPVAQQVSQLVILHEEAEDGNAMPDLALPIQAVGAAVANLVQVGKETATKSTDKILKKEMPIAFTRVEESSILLVEASKLLKKDPYSSQARKKLIDGSRGILSGTSALLLTFDEAEVRKILAYCKNVIDYLAVSEQVENLQDLTTFVKNLTPGLSSMAKMVEAREKELTHQIHASILRKCIASVKDTVPVAISALKNYVKIPEIEPGVKGEGCAEAQANRSYFIMKMTGDIHEIMRVLQLTTYDEDDSNDPLNEMKKAASLFDSKLGMAQEWLASPTTSGGGFGEMALRDCINQGRKLAEACGDPDRSRIQKVCDDLDQLLGELSDLRNRKQGTSPQAMALSKKLAQGLSSLQDQIEKAIQHQEVSGTRKPNSTFVGKMEQAHTWLNNPAGDHSGLGHKAIQECIQEGKKSAEKLSGPERTDILRLCDELDKLTRELDDLKRRGMGNSPQAHALAAKIESKLEELNRKLQRAAIAQVAEDYMDTMSGIKNLEKAARAAPGTPGRNDNFQVRAAEFENQANQLANTAIQVANTGGKPNKMALDDIRQTADELKQITPQVQHAAKLVLIYPDNQTHSAHLDSMKAEWKGKVDKLTDLVDSVTDPAQFITACEEAIKKDVEACELAMEQENPQLVIAKTSNIARRTKRVTTVAIEEANNTEDSAYADQLLRAADAAGETVTPMVISAKSVATNIGDRNARKRLRDDLRKVQDGVSGVRVIVVGSAHTEPDEEDFPPPPPPDIAALNLEPQEEAPPRPPPPSEAAPPRPPPPPEEIIDQKVQNVLEQPPEDNRMAMAAHNLHREALKWEAQGNDIIQAVKKMAILFAKMSKYMSDAEEGEPYSKKELIDLAKQIAIESREVVKHARKVADQCSDKRLKQVMQQTIDRIPTVGTQLKIVATVKATMIGAQDPKSDLEATETLVGCAENLMSAVRQTVRETEAASVKLRSEAGHVLRWKKK